MLVTLLLAALAPSATASATLRLEPASGPPGTSFDATSTLDEESCAEAEGRSVTFVWDYGTSAARTLGAAPVSGKSCKAGLKAAVPSDAAGGSHTVGAYIDGVDGSTATAGFTVEAATTTTTTTTTTTSTTTTTTTTTTTISAPSSSTTSPSPPGEPPPPPNTPTTAPAEDVPTDVALPPEDQTGSAPSSSTSTSLAPSSSTSERDPSTTTTEKVGVAFAAIGCPRPGEAVAAAAGGFPFAGVTLGGTALGGAVLAGILVARRRTAMAPGVVVLAAAALVAASPLPAAAQSVPEDESDRPIAVATISGIAGSVSVLEIEPAVDLESSTQRVLTSPWTITKPLDDASPALVEAVTTGDALRCVEFQFTENGDDSEPRAIFALADVRVGRVEHRANASGATPTEEVDLHYSRLAYRYRPVADDGSLGPTVEGVLP